MFGRIPADQVGGPHHVVDPTIQLAGQFSMFSFANAGFVDTGY